MDLPYPPLLRSYLRKEQVQIREEAQLPSLSTIYVYMLEQ